MIQKNKFQIKIQFEKGGDQLPKFYLSEGIPELFNLNIYFQSKFMIFLEYLLPSLLIFLQIMYTNIFNSFLTPPIFVFREWKFKQQSSHKFERLNKIQKKIFYSYRTYCTWKKSEKIAVARMVWNIRKKEGIFLRRFGLWEILNL